MKISDGMYPGTTTLELEFGPLRLRTTLSGIPKNIRYQWLLLIHQALLQLLNEFTLRGSSLSHSNSPLVIFQQVEKRVSLYQAFKLDPEKRRDRFGFRIRLLRLQSRMTQKEMAKLLGTPRTHLSAVEHGKVSLRRSTLAKWENILRYTMKTDLKLPETDRPFLFETDKRQTFLQGTILRNGDVELKVNGQRVPLQDAVLRTVSFLDRVEARETGGPHETDRAAHYSSNFS